jgi:molybdate transport system substrate-binding protein
LNAVPWTTAQAAELRVLCTVALGPVYDEVIPVFERATGHKVTVVYATSGAVADRVRKGEIADVLITSRAGIESLIKQGRLTAENRTALAKAGIGVAIRKGAPKPNMGSIDSFRATLIAAKSIAHGNPANGGVASAHLVKVFERLGIAEQVRVKAVLGGPGAVAPAVAKGTAEIGMTQVSEILPEPGVELAGLLPAELQNITPYAGAVVAGSKQTTTASALLQFLASPAAETVLRAKGMEPG